MNAEFAHSMYGARDPFPIPLYIIYDPVTGRHWILQYSDDGGVIPSWDPMTPLGIQ